MKNKAEGKLSSKVLAGAGWAMGMRWAIKLLGLLSSAIVARQLMPEDYGLVAIAMVAVGLATVLFEFGVETAVVQNDAATREHYDTAWTVRIIQAMFVAGCVLLFSPFSDDFFDDARLPFILQLVALSVLLQGFENIGIVRFRKELEFSKDFQFYVVSKVLGIAITISLALYLKSYFALVLGMLGQSLVSVGYSYIICSYRPRVSLAAFGDIWHFSKWLLLKNLSDYIGRRGDVIMLSKLASVQGLGFYKWGSELALMNTSDIVYPMLRSLMPGLVKVKSERTRLESAFLLSSGMIAIVAVPTGVGLSAVAAEFIPFFLGGGDKWSGVIPILQILAYSAMFHSLYIVAANMLIVIDLVRLTTFTSWARTVLVLALLYPAFQLYGMEGVAWSQLFISVITCVIIYGILAARLSMPFARILGVFWRPILAGLLMSLVLYQVAADAGDILALVLLAKIFIGIIIYSACLYCLWYLSGAPDSAEKKAFMMAYQRIAKRRG